MNCAEAGRLISEHLDGRLDEARLKMLSAHLSQCPACAKEHQGLRRLNSLLGVWESEPVSPDLKARILKAADRPQKAPATRAHVVLRWAAVLIIGVFLGGALLLLAGRENGEEGESKGLGNDGVVVVEKTPELPPEVAALCVRLSPLAGDAALEMSRRTASAVLGTSGVLRKRAGAIPEHIGTVAERFVEGFVPPLRKGTERLLHKPVPPEERDNGVPRQSSFTAGKEKVAAVFPERAHRRDRARHDGRALLDVTA
ncbi:MAG: anti-sigma factor family protein [Planctomycetota bacterium]|jgi:hypothetical protein